MSRGLRPRYMVCNFIWDVHNVGGKLMRSGVECMYPGDSNLTLGPWPAPWPLGQPVQVDYYLKSLYPPIFPHLWFLNRNDGLWYLYVCVKYDCSQIFLFIDLRCFSKTQIHCLAGMEWNVRILYIWLWYEVVSPSYLKMNAPTVNHSG